jgi:hypothetical protein
MAIFPWYLISHQLLAIQKQKPAAFHRQRVSKPLGEESF